MSCSPATDSACEKLQAAFDRYVAVATLYTTRVVHDWLNDVRAHFTPFAPDSWQANLEGYSLDGAISRWAFTEIKWARPHVTYELPENPSQAELEGIVYHKPPEAVLDMILPLAKPAMSAKTIVKERDLVQQCIAESGVPEDQIPLPEEYFHLITLTWLIKAAGIPSHIADEEIFMMRLWWQSLHQPRLPKIDRVRRGVKLEVAIAWQINDFANEPHGDEVFYACCRPRAAAEAVSEHPFAWRVLKWSSFTHVATFQSLADYLDSESERLEAAMRLDPKSDDWIEHYRDPSHPDYALNDSFPWPGQPRWADRQRK